MTKRNDRTPSGGVISVVLAVLADAQFVTAGVSFAQGHIGDGLGFIIGGLLVGFIAFLFFAGWLYDDTDEEGGP